MIDYIRINKRVKSQYFDTYEEAYNALLNSISHEINKTSWEEIVFQDDKYYFEYLSYIDYPKDN